MLIHKEYSQYLYLMINNFPIKLRNYTFEYPIPIRVCVKNYDKFEEVLGDTKYLYISKGSLSDTTELVVDDYSKKLLMLQVIASNQITFHDLDFDIDSYLSYNSYIAINITNDSFEKWEKYLPALDTQPKIHVFNSLIVLIIDENKCPAYMFSENNKFGVITNKDLNIAAFFINNITEKDKKIIKEHANYLNSPNQESAFPFNKCKTTIMEHKNYLIKKIIELENVNLWDVIYYGLERKLINNNFVIESAIAMLEHNKTSDNITLEIASLLNHELEKVSILLNEKVNKDEVMINKGPFYNKIWLYLSVASDMCAAKIIK